MRLSEKKLRSLIRNAILKENLGLFPWIAFWSTAIDHDEIAKRLGSKEFLTFALTTATGLLGTGVAGARLAYLAGGIDLHLAYEMYKKDETFLSALFVALGVIPLVPNIMKKGSGKLLAKELEKKGLKSVEDIEKVINKAKNKKELTPDQKEAFKNLDKFFVDAVKDPKIKELLDSGAFIKFDYKNPKIGKPSKYVTGRTEVVKNIGLYDEFVAMKNLKDILGDRMIGPIGNAEKSFISTSSGKKQVSAIAMEKLPPGRSLSDALYMEEDLSVNDLQSIYKQLSKIKDILVKNSDVVHGDLHMGNIYISKNNKVIIFDPAGFHKGSAKNLPDHISYQDTHLIDLKKIEDAKKAITNKPAVRAAIKKGMFEVDKVKPGSSGTPKPRSRKKLDTK